MRIGPVRRELRDGRPAVCARVTWEDADRPPDEIFFSFENPEGTAPADGADAFLIGAFLPALRGGERRIRLDEAISPCIGDGLRSAAAVLEGWYGEGRATPRLEPAGGFRAGMPARGSGLFLSGGLDSLFLLMSHRERFAPHHPGAIGLGIALEAFAMVPDPDAAARISARTRAAAAAVAADARLPLTFVSTNLLELHDDFAFFARQSHGSVLAAVAQLHAGRIGSAWAAASDDVASGLGPWGSHPALDPLFGTEAVAFVHDGIGHTRLEKARFVGSSPAARRHLYVCGEPRGTGDPNCGRCEKCLRTMMELLVTGGLARSEVFPRDVAPAAILDFPDVPAFRALAYYWDPLVDPLRRIGRADLSDAVARRLNDERRNRAWHAGRGWKGRLRRADRALLGGRLMALRRLGARSTPAGT